VVGSFNGAGDTITPTVLNLICFWACQIPLAYFLAFPGGMGPTGPFVAVVVCDSPLAVLGILWFRRGTWKKQIV
jgi:Na+-driven multidrug efflux pump